MPQGREEQEDISLREREAERSFQSATETPEPVSQVPSEQEEEKPYALVTKGSNGKVLRSIPMTKEQYEGYLRRQYEAHKPLVLCENKEAVERLLEDNKEVTIFASDGGNAQKRLDRGLPLSDKQRKVNNYRIGLSLAVATAGVGFIVASILSLGVAPAILGGVIAFGGLFNAAIGDQNRLRDIQNQDDVVKVLEKLSKGGGAESPEKAQTHSVALGDREQQSLERTQSASAILKPSAERRAVERRQSPQGASLRRSNSTPSL